MQLKKLQMTAVLLLMVLMLGVTSLQSYEGRRNLVFAEEINAVVLTVDGKELLLSDLAFYIAYQEREIEHDAKIYDREDTDAYWNLRTDNGYLRIEGKNAVIDMAVHDAIFYQKALEEGLELTEEEEKLLANDQYDFWSDLEEEQREALGIEKEVIDESMRKLAMAEKYQYLLAAIEQETYEEYAFTGAEYQKLLEKHSYEVNEDLWNRIRFGGVTYHH